MGYHMYVPKGYEAYKKQRLEELKRLKKAEEEYLKATEWRMKYYIA